MTSGLKAPSCRVRRRFSIVRFGRSSDGATAVEFALLTIPFLMATFAILETGISMGAQQMLVNATDNVAREIRTGQVNVITQSQLKTKICDRIQWLVKAGCPGLQVDLRSYTTFQLAAAQQIYVMGNTVALEKDGAGKAKALKSEIGGSNAKQTLRAFYFWPLMTNLMQSSMATAGNGNALLSASQTWQNEKY